VSGSSSPAEPNSAVPEPAASRVAFAGRHLSIVTETWPGIGEWEVLRKHSAAAIVPITPNGDVILVRQFRVPVRRTLVEVPAGLLDLDGEDPLTCARRELHEETGYRADPISFLGGLFMSPGASDEYVHFFLGETDSEPMGRPEAGIEVVRRPFADMVAAANAGKLRDAMTTVALLLAAARRSTT
jgi:8-oxo-dGTP pyrophosphatase MutT (NUDIX family)